MKISVAAIAAGILLASLPSGGEARRADHVLVPQSLALTQQGVAAQSKGELDRAIDYYEAALVVDPRNRGAIIALAQIARAQGLPGKAIALYREALLLDPSDVNAVGGQGEALVDKGALQLARERLAELDRLCAKGCAQRVALAKAIEAGEARKLVSAEAITPKPVVSTAPEAVD